MERTRRQFAEARNMLMKLVMHRAVDVDSTSFKFFYYINTAFMRRPDQYQDVCGVLVSLFLHQENSSSGDELLAESKTWSEGFKAVVRETANALGYVVIDYSWLMRLAFKLGRKEASPFHMLSSVRAQIVAREERIAEIAEARKAMYKMAEMRPSTGSLAHA